MSVILFLSWIAIEPIRGSEAPWSIVSSLGIHHDDIPVVGYDNYWLPMVQANPKLVPPFATVDKRNRDIGRAMARLLLDRTSGRLAPNPQHIKLEPKVLPRH